MRSPHRRRVLEISSTAIDKTRREPIYQQLVRFFHAAIASGRLPAGAMLPSSRQLALQLNVSRATIVSVYDMLLSEGLVESTVGSGTIVRAAAEQRCGGARRGHSAASAAATHNNTHNDRQIGIFEPRRPPTDHVQSAVWRRLVVDQSPGRLSTTTISTADAWRLRENIATYLLLSRGLRCTPEQVVVGASVQQILALIAQIARDEAIAFHFEPLSPERARRAFERQGATVGILHHFLHEDPNIDKLTNAGIFTAPSCQYPLGTRLARNERETLAEALDRSGLWAIEDARDFEFLDADPAPTLYELRSGRQTFHVGALSTVLLPFVRLAYVVAPPSIALRLLNERRATDDDIPAGIQSAASEMLETGMFHSVTRSARQTTERRRALFHLCAARHSIWTLPPTDARRGLHSLLWVDTCDTPFDLQTTLDALGMGVEVAAAPTGHPPRRAALVMGFADVQDDVMDHQLARIAATVERTVSRRPELLR